MPDPSREELLADLLDAIPHLVWMTDAAGRPTYFNANWASYTGADLEETLRVGGVEFIHPGDQEQYRSRAEAGRRSLAPFEIVQRLRRHDGTYRRHRCRVVPLTPGAPGAWAATGTDVEDEYQFELQQEFLVEAGKRLGASLDSTKTLGDVAALLVPRIADWFAVDLFGENGIAERVAMAHADPSKVETAWEFHRRMPPRPEDEGGIYGVMRSGKPQLMEEIPDELLAAAITDPLTLSLIRALGLHSSLCVPLRTGDRTVGALTLVSAESKRRYGPRDLAFAENLAGRIAMAVENARLFELAQRARIASEAIAADVIAQSAEAQALIATIRRERDEALSKLDSASRE